MPRNLLSRVANSLRVRPVAKLTALGAFIFGAVFPFAQEISETFGISKLFLQTFLLSCVFAFIVVCLISLWWYRRDSAKRLSKYEWIALAAAILLILIAPYMIFSRLRSIEPISLRQIALAEEYCEPQELLADNPLAQEDQHRLCEDAVAAIQHWDDEESAKRAIKALASGNPMEAKELYWAMMKRESDEGEANLKQAADKAQKLGALEFVKNPGLALIYYRKATTWDPSNILAQLGLANSALLSANLEESEQANKKVIELAEPSQDWKTLCIAYSNLAAAYLFQGRLEEAEASQKEAFRIAQQLNYEEGEAASYLLLGVIANKRNESELAERSQQSALHLYTKIKKQHGIALADLNLSNIYIARGDFSDALIYVNRALEINSIAKDRFGLVDNFNVLSQIKFARNDLDEAESSARQAVDLAGQIGSNRQLQIALDNLGNVQVARGDYQAAEVSYEKSLELAQRLGRYEAVGGLYFDLAELYGRWGRSGDAVEMGQRAVKQFEMLGVNAWLIDAYKEMGQIFQNVGQPVRAKEYFEKASGVAQRSDGDG